ncbi:MAG: ArgE/DapE family deacylase [Furfurilactobacillus sp.]|jgi:succinyl-diaminopimelate desuccinylase|uniref:Probable succinyl-diaminopimelate desuccinylase n=1 Tax=Furfurilactobacillus milii TaxID=2888272 RepID=A0ABT6DCV4_9LACO|nr:MULTISPECIES: ArgE/DapE family deacylase [Furfurilactobacillus]QLE67624.1 Acetylornithine deacetylase-Succinyl-diaminopime late desuccinylase related deacylase [Furfurilactobacillus rossiae]MCF6160526.1 ArgE/DapE family deacylase [Furfurilactobacillus milii]MCF6162758.1 ArgE/DapE family deacylase [Furfurilactobacillus milii]MCF6418232.1 ArgE/DapE family deacylase [Furfurilactobacillus milii]MCH4011754.1 ArgE/DapE family deacylase [Furfurilactobacillus sp.]
MNQEEKLKLLSDLIGVPSVNGREREVALILQSFLKSHGITAHLIDYDTDRSNLIASYGDKKTPVLGFSGHMDVVTANEKEWQSFPFALTAVGDHLIGRGTADQKAGVAAQAIALAELADAHAKLNGQVRLLFTVGEEVGEYGAQQLTELGYADDLSGLVISEPSSQDVWYANQGSIDYTVVSTGKTSHSSMPDLGVNALDNLVTFYNALQQALQSHQEESPILGKFHNSVTTFHAGDQVNTIPNHAELQGNARTIPEFDNTAFIALITNAVNRLNESSSMNLGLTINFNKMPVVSGKDSPLVHQTVDIAQEITGKNLQVIGMVGTTDSSEFIKAKTHFPIIVYGPGITQQAHQPNEFVSKRAYFQSIDVYRELAKRFLNKAND